MKNGVFSCGESKRLQKHEVSLVKGQLTVVKIQNIGFLTLIYPKCTTAKGKLAEKQRHLLKTKYKNAEKTVRKAYKQIDTQGTSKDARHLIQFQQQAKRLH